MDGTLRPTKVGERVGGWVALFKANRRRRLSDLEGSFAQRCTLPQGLASTERAGSLLCPSLANPKELAIRCLGIPISSFLMAKGKERRGCGLGSPAPQASRT